MSKVKYMGTADVRLIEAGENFGGRLATPISETLRFTQADNAFVVDTDEAGLSPEAVSLLLEEGQGFLDVTDMEVVPPNLNQTTFLGFPVLAGSAPAGEVTEGGPAPSGGRIVPPEDQEVRPA